MEASSLVLVLSLLFLSFLYNSCWCVLVMGKRKGLVTLAVVLYDQLLLLLLLVVVLVVVVMSSLLYYDGFVSVLVFAVLLWRRCVPSATVLQCHSHHC